MNSDFIIAVHSLTFLAHVEERLATSDHIATSVSVHPVRVRKVLSLLRKHGYIRSKEGAKGGFELIRSPEGVTLDELYRLTAEGSIKPKWPNPNPQCLIGAHIESSMDSIFTGAEQQMERYFGGYTIADVLDIVQQQAKG
ncbi:Rrf2 family transcriptional regulator [Paenibacillus ginsengarvi]|uniref:Rrf2 family transcriptional regulator n=1 Tax=Paenibacillus ginsengarvi TaxID=400777 RepID=A0A3B0C096_9BACL|nr:Rrf2 family transcriptional regulator [Paenibacillus ginsengarvi]RKN78211.1 Rrf2 family transcriptional regulator [Paenibacillus ginsengarvi]